MRVALLSRSARPLHPPGGMENAVYHLAHHLRLLGVETVLLTRPATEGGAFASDVVSIRYGSFPGIPHGSILDRTLFYPAFSERVGRRVSRLVREGRVDLVDAQGLTALGYGRARRRDPTLRAPLVMNPQGMEEHKAAGWKRVALTRLRRLSQEAARLSDRVVATDQATRAEVLRLLSVKPERVVVLPNGIDPGEIQSLTPTDPGTTVADTWPALRPAFPLLLSVGRLETYKGFGDIVQALAALERGRRLPETWAWAVVGRGPDLSSLIRQSDRHGLGSHVYFLGSADPEPLHALYAAATVFVHATRYEGSSLVTLEAMAHGLPVIATRAGGIPDKVIAGQTGWLVDPQDVDALAESIHQAVADPERARAFGERGRQRALELFAWPAIAQRVLALYEELLREGRR